MTETDKIVAAIFAATMCSLPDSCSGFSATFTTVAFDHSSLRWLEINT